MKAWDDFKASSPMVQIIIAFMVIFVAVGLLCTCIFVFRMFTGTSELVNRLDHGMVFVTPTTSSAPAEPTLAPEEPAPPTIQPSPTPIIFTAWRGEYFDNPNLEGEPVLVRNDEHIDFDWTDTSPDPGTVPDSNYSVRWTTSRDIPADSYRLNVHFSGGVKVWVDEFLVIDDWQDGPARTASADVNVAAGFHVVRVEYYHFEGPAEIQFSPQQQQNFPDWKAEYFDNPALSNAPVAVRNEKEINYNWGAESPVPDVVPADNYSIRWTQMVNFETGNQLFLVDVEGGVRVWLDGQVLIDSWGESERRQLHATTQLNRGGHGLIVEYWKATGNGLIQFGWGLLPEQNQPPVAVLSGPTSGFAGQNLSFSASTSRAAEGSNLVGITWDMGDGTTATDVLNVTHAYANPGQYVVSLTVVDTQGLSNTTTQTVTITQAQATPATPPPGQAPVAVINAPSQGVVAQIITFDGAQSYSSNSITQYQWAFGDGTYASGSRVQHVFNKGAAYNVLLTVTDSTGLTGQSTRAIQIQALPSVPTATPMPGAPIPIIAVDPSSQQAEVGQTVTFDASQSTAQGTIVSYAWNLGDGTNVNAITVPHQYQNPGVYNIILTLTDSNNLASSSNTQVQINAPGITPQPTTMPPTNTPVATNPPGATDTPPPVATNLPVATDTPVPDETPVPTTTP